MKVFVLKNVMDQVGAIADKLKLRSKTVVDYFLENQFSVLTPLTVDSATNLARAHFGFVVNVNVSRKAKSVVQGLSVSLGLQEYVVTAYILLEALSVLSVDPQAYPALLKGFKSGNSSTTVTAGMDLGVYNWIKTNLEQTGFVSVTAFVDSILISLVQDEVRSQEFADGLQSYYDNVNDGSSREPQSVRLSYDNYTLISSLARSLNIPRKTVLSYLLSREISAHFFDVLQGTTIKSKDIAGIARHVLKDL